MGAARRLLVIDDHASIRELLSSWARQRGYDAQMAADGQQALAELERQPFDLVISDMRMPGLTGLELLKHMPSTNERAAVVFITAFGNVQEAVQAMHEGAVDYVTKPFNVEDLFERIEARLRAASTPPPAAAVVPAHSDADSVSAGMVAANASCDAGLLQGAPENLRRLYDLLDQVAPARCTVFISGPSGVGKELVATELHLRSARAGRPFVRVNCPAIPKELQESELFGHEKGAFTGATRRKEGKFFFANGGTILLDEISETSLAFQSKLLRVLQ
ncbi:MAG: sigma-54-dependent Fis family transcriptional regulator, partial [Candidatus Latescibacterota bacterium]